MANLTIPTQMLDAKQIDRAVQHGRVLRSKAFMTMLRQAYIAIFGPSKDEKSAFNHRYRDCTSAA